jgi:hypothetical protein
MVHLQCFLPTDTVPVPYRYVLGRDPEPIKLGIAHFFVAYYYAQIATTDP